MIKNILITGVAGFIGSHLSERLINEGHRVIGVDNLSTGSIHNIKHLIGSKSFEFHELDIIEEFNIDSELDYIFHLASPASPMDYLRLPIETLKVSSIGTTNVLELALIKGARVLIASTSEVYGDPLVHPQSENYWGNVNPIGPRSVYDESKRFQESLTMAYHTNKGLEVRIARLFNVYGPKMRPTDGRVLPTFMRQALANEPLTIFGDGTQTRSFCYVSDTVDGLIKLMESNYSSPVNIGNPSELTISQFAHQIIKLTGSTSNLMYMVLPADDPKRRCPNIELANSILNWSPLIDIEEGLTKTLEYFKNN